MLIYFHGNAEDVGLATELLDYVRALLRVINSPPQSLIISLGSRPCC